MYKKKLHISKIFSNLEQLVVKFYYLVICKLFAIAIKPLYHDCSIFDDKEYIGAEVQLDLFETANIRLEYPYRLNQKNLMPAIIPFAKVGKRVKKSFLQLTDYFLVIRNYAKETCGLFVRIVGKVSVMTALQHINYINKKPIGRIEYALI